MPQCHPTAAFVRHKAQLFTEVSGFSTALALSVWGVRSESRFRSTSVQSLADIVQKSVSKRTRACSAESSAYTHMFEGTQWGGR